MNNKIYDYPKNLICDVLNQGDAVLPDDAERAVSYVICTALMPRESNALFFYYHEGYTFEQIGRERGFGVTRERVRQIIEKALKKLRKPVWSGYLIYGYEVQEKRKAERETQERLREQAYQQLPFTAKKLEDLDLSVRSFNSLRRAGCRTAGDVLSLGREALIDLRCLGKKSVAEIESKIFDCAEEEAMAEVESVVTADSEEEGRWIMAPHTFSLPNMPGSIASGKYPTCSRCGAFETGFGQVRRFCPGCGVKMKLED